jgi:hypothetical protein
LETSNAHAGNLIEEGQRRKDVAHLFKVSRTTLYLALAVYFR